MIKFQQFYMQFQIGLLKPISNVIIVLPVLWFKTVELNSFQIFGQSWLRCCLFVESSSSLLREKFRRIRKSEKRKLFRLYPTSTTIRPTTSFSSNFLVRRKATFRKPTLIYVARKRPDVRSWESRRSPSSLFPKLRKSQNSISEFTRLCRYNIRINKEQVLWIIFIRGSQPE